MAKQLNCKVIGTSRNDSQDLEYVDKIVNTNSNFKKTIGDSNIDLILDNLGGALFSDYIEVIKPNGKIISFGNSMEEKINLSTRDLFYKQVNILGSSVGSKKEFIDMLSFVKNNNITPFVEYIFEFDKFLDAINLLKSKNYKGNIAIVL
ncbi:zinc-binding dehydrogenase [Staphylococcus felis]